VGGVLLIPGRGLEGGRGGSYQDYVNGDLGAVRGQLARGGIVGGMRKAGYPPPSPHPAGVPGHGSVGWLWTGTALKYCGNIQCVQLQKVTVRW